MQTLSGHLFPWSVVCSMFFSSFGACFCYFGDLIILIFIVEYFPFLPVFAISYIYFYKNMLKLFKLPLYLCLSTLSSIGVWNHVSSFYFIILNYLIFNVILCFINAIFSFFNSVTSASNSICTSFFFSFILSSIYFLLLNAWSFTFCIQACITKV